MKPAIIAIVASLMVSPALAEGIGPPRCHGTSDVRAYHDKRAMAAARGIADPWRWQLDHYYSLELGGPDDESNLMFQPWPEARLKDEDEWRLGALVCSGQMTQDDAIKELTAKWPRELER